MPVPKFLRALEWCDEWPTVASRRRCWRIGGLKCRAGGGFGVLLIGPYSYTRKSAAALPHLAFHLFPRPPMRTKSRGRDASRINERNARIRRANCVCCCGSEDQVTQPAATTSFIFRSYPCPHACFSSMSRSVCQTESLRVLQARRSTHKHDLRSCTCNEVNYSNASSYGMLP